MSTIKSSAEHLTLNADGASKDIKFQADGVEKASISSAGLFTSTTIDATKLTGNLPAISGASLTSLTSGNLTGALPMIDGSNLTNMAAGGKVLQVVEGTHTTQETTTSTSYVATSLDAVITPSATSSKILVNITFPADCAGSSTHTGGDYALYRDSTHILVMSGDSYYCNISSVNMASNIALQKVDSPNTTSAVTYTLYMRARNSSTIMKSCHNGSMGTVTLMEIGA